MTWRKGGGISFIQQRIRLFPNGDREPFPGNHPRFPCYATRFLSREDVTRLSFQPAHSMSDVSYILHIQRHGTCKCTFLTHSFPVLPWEESLATFSIEESDAGAETTWCPFTHTTPGPAPTQQQLASSSRQAKDIWIIVHTNERH